MGEAIVESTEAGFTRWCKGIISFCFAAWCFGFEGSLFENLISQDCDIIYFNIQHVQCIYFHFSLLQSNLNTKKNISHPKKRHVFSSSLPFSLRQPVKRLCNWPCRVASLEVMLPQQLRRMACPAASCGPRTIRWTMWRQSSGLSEGWKTVPKSLEVAKHFGKKYM